MRFLKIACLVSFLLNPSLINAQILCKDLPSTYTNYSNALHIIGKTNFLIKDKVSTSSSSWINGASFSSCDGKIGFLIVQIRNKNYVHQNVPIAIWKNFKTSSSYGNFYNQNIKNKYRLKLR